MNLLTNSMQQVPPQARPTDDATMSEEVSSAATMRTVRFHGYGEPNQVLRFEQVAVPAPGAGQIRVAVHATGLNPADWALCRGLFPGHLPRGIGLEVSGKVDAIGEGVTDVAVGDLVLGTTDYARASSAGASDYAIMNHWAPVPDGLDLVEAAAMPIVVETAHRSVEQLGVTAGQTLVVHGAGTMVGFAAVQIALIRGAVVVATAGSTYSDRLRALGALVTPYGDGMARRVLDLAQKPADLVLDTGPVSGSLPSLIQIAGGNPRRVLTIVDFAAAPKLGVRDTFHEAPTTSHYSVSEYAELAAKRRFGIPIARVFSLEDWRAALNLSQSGQSHGKILLQLADVRSRA